MKNKDQIKENLGKLTEGVSGLIKYFLDSLTEKVLEKDEEEEEPDEDVDD